MRSNKFLLNCSFLTCLSMVVLLSSSCRKLELEPKDWFGKDLVFDTMDVNGTIANFNLNDIYNYIPGGFNRIGGDFLDAATDDAIPSRNNTLVEYFTNGRISVLNNPDAYFGNSYYGIRRVNIFLANINNVALPDTGSTNPTYASTVLLRQYWRAEARFLRAFFYWELLKRYGGVPLIGNRIFTLDDDLQIPRNTFEECVNYIVSECDAVKDSLRKEPVADNDWGRVPRGAAIALKCRVLLYAASPLFNGGGSESDPAKKALTGYVNNDPARWQKVIDAAEEFKAIGYYTLQASYTSLFTTKKNTEVIFQKQSSNNSGLETSQSPVGFNTSSLTSQGLTSPTQNLVDAFPMANGLGINETGSGYSASNPYNGRDPRLAATVFYNGTTWLKRKVETFEGGLDKPNSSAIPVQTKTGYYLRKFLADFSNSTTFSNQSHNFIIFRYAEILLNYAEALNEMGRTEDAVKEILSIRKRAGITAGTSNRYGIKAGITQDEMRTLIRNERRIELAFEEHRFWDVRRWKTAAQDLNGTVYGMKITNNAGVFTYEKVPVKSLLFSNKLYHLPIPYDETTKNLKLIQNEGW